MDDDTEHMLTTVDNPWNPWTDYDAWYAYDHTAGYDSPGLLARIAKVSIELSDVDFESAIEQAIKEIVTVNASGMHVMVSAPSIVNNLKAMMGRGEADST